MAMANKPDSDGSKQPKPHESIQPGLSEIFKGAQDLLEDREATRFLDLKDGTLSVWRSTGRYKLPFIKIGRKVRYRRSDLEEWLAGRTRANGATA